MRDLFFSHEVTQGVLQFHGLDKKVVLGVQVRRTLRALEIKRKPLLDAPHFSPLSKVHEQEQIQDQRSCKDAVLAQEINLDLHRVPEPAEDIDAVPALFVVSLGRVIVDGHLVIEVPVKLRIHLGLQNGVQDRKFARLFGLERILVIQDKAVPVAENIDLLAIKKSILGKRETEAKRFILSLPNVKDVRFVFSLSLRDVVPSRESRANVKLGE